MGNYIFKFSETTQQAVQDAFGPQAWEKLTKYTEAELKSGLPTIGGFIQKRIKDGKMPGLVWALIDPKLQPAEVAAKNLYRMAHGQPCMLHFQGDSQVYEGPDGTVVLALQVGKHWLLSSQFREVATLPAELKPKAAAVPQLDAEVWMAAHAPAPAAPSQAAGGKKREDGGSLDEIFARVEAKMQAGQVVMTETDEIFHFSILMTEEFVERYGIQGAVKKRGIQVHGREFCLIYDKDIPNFFRDEPMEDEITPGFRMDIQTIYGSTDIAFRREGRDLFQLTKITRLDLGHYFYLDLKPANPAYTKKVEEADVAYILILKK